VSLYEIANAGLVPPEPVALADLGLRERGDLQRLLRDDIGVLDDDLLVVAGADYAVRALPGGRRLLPPGRLLSLL
jgi:hypothetical protein